MPENDPALSMRPFSPEADMPLICKWISEKYAVQLPSPDLQSDQLGKAWLSMLEAGAARVFIGLVGDEPICEIELYEISQHEISLYYAYRPGDYYLDLMPASPTAGENMTGLLRNALEYLFSFPEVGRIVAEADIHDEWMNTLLKSAGFYWHTHLSIPKRVSNLYIRTKS
jgi:acetyl CoA:N6-hydroxylysine acetyl transferase